MIYGGLFLSGVPFLCGDPDLHGDLFQIAFLAPGMSRNAFSTSQSLTPSGYELIAFKAKQR